MEKQQVLNGEFLQKLEGQELDLCGSSYSCTAGWTSIPKKTFPLSVIPAWRWCRVANIRGKNFSLLIHGGKKIRWRRRERFPGPTTKWMRRKRNNTDLSLFYCLDVFLHMSSNEAKAESTTVKNLVVEMFANHRVRKMVFCCKSHTRDTPN